jgi:hypothetical protein
MDRKTMIENLKKAAHEHGYTVRKVRGWDRYFTIGGQEDDERLSFTVWEGDDCYDYRHPKTDRRISTRKIATVLKAVAAKFEKKEAKRQREKERKAQRKRQIDFLREYLKPIEKLVKVTYNRSYPEADVKLDGITINFDARTYDDSLEVETEVFVQKDSGPTIEQVKKMIKALRK